jgi:hypothetical protein
VLVVLCHCFGSLLVEKLSQRRYDLRLKRLPGIDSTVSRTTVAAVFITEPTATRVTESTGNRILTALTIFTMSDEAKKTTTISIAVTPEMKAEIQAVAKLKRWSVSQTIGVVLEEYWGVWMVEADIDFDSIQGRTKTSTKKKSKT